MSVWPLGAPGGAGGAVAASFRALRTARAGGAGSGRTWNLEDGLGCRPAAGVVSRPRGEAAACERVACHGTTPTRVAAARVPNPGRIGHARAVARDFVPAELLAA